MIQRGRRKIKRKNCGGTGAGEEDESHEVATTLIHRTWKGMKVLNQKNCNRESQR
jgi:hypothetical protein